MKDTISLKNELTINRTRRKDEGMTDMAGMADLIMLYNYESDIGRLNL